MWFQTCALASRIGRATSVGLAAEIVVVVGIGGDMAVVVVGMDRVEALAVDKRRRHHAIDPTRAVDSVHHRRTSHRRYLTRTFF